MVRSRAVIAERLRRVAAEEYRAGVADFLEQRMRVCDRKFEVLRGNAVDEITRFIEVVHLDQCAARLERGLDNIAPWHTRELTLDARSDLIYKLCAGRDQDCLRKLVVLGLREQIHRDPVGEVGRRRGAVTYHQDFRR